MLLTIIGFFSALLIILGLIKVIPPFFKWLGNFVDNALDIDTDTPERVSKAKNRVEKLKVEKETLTTEVKSEKKAGSLKREISKLESKLPTKE